MLLQIVLKLQLLMFADENVPPTFAGPVKDDFPTGQHTLAQRKRDDVLEEAKGTVTGKSKLGRDQAAENAKLLIAG